LPHKPLSSVFGDLWQPKERDNTATLSPTPTLSHSLPHSLPHSPSPTHSLTLSLTLSLSLSLSHADALRLDSHSVPPNLFWERSQMARYLIIAMFR
jgi:hypothetical protein